MKKDIYDNEEWLGILDGIQQHPDEDDRRLIAADWLEDHEWEHWAQVIRWQIDRRNSKIYSPSEQERQLIKSLERDLLHHLPKYFTLQADTVGLGGWSSGCILYRGFITHIEGLWKNWSHFQDQSRFVTCHPVQSVGLQGNVGLTYTHHRKNGTITFSVCGYPYLQMEVYARAHFAEPNVDRATVHRMRREIFKKQWPKIKFFFRSHDER